MKRYVPPDPPIRELRRRAEKGEISLVVLRPTGTVKEEGYVPVGTVTVVYSGEGSMVAYSNTYCHNRDEEELLVPVDFNSLDDEGRRFYLSFLPQSEVFPQREKSPTVAVLAPPPEEVVAVFWFNIMIKGNETGLEEGKNYPVTQIVLEAKIPTLTEFLHFQLAGRVTPKFEPSYPSPNLSDEYFDRKTLSAIAEDVVRWVEGEASKVLAITKAEAGTTFPPETNEDFVHCILQEDLFSHKPSFLIKVVLDSGVFPSDTEEYSLLSSRFLGRWKEKMAEFSEGVINYILNRLNQVARDRSILSQSLSEKGYRVSFDEVETKGPEYYRGVAYSHELEFLFFEEGSCFFSTEVLKGTARSFLDYFCESVIPAAKPSPGLQELREYISLVSSEPSIQLSVNLDIADTYKWLSTDVLLGTPPPDESFSPFWVSPPPPGLIEGVSSSGVQYWAPIPRVKMFFVFPRRRPSKPRRS